MADYGRAQGPKSPLHGVTRRIEIPESDDEDDQITAESSLAWPLPATRLPRPKLPEDRLIGASVYTKIRGSSPYSQDAPGDADDREDPVWSPMGAPSAIPRPLKKTCEEAKRSSPEPLVSGGTSFSEVRHPSYEGNGYQNEISLTNLHARKASAGGGSIVSDIVPSKPRSRLPGQIRLPPPYNAQRELRVASDDTFSRTIAPKHLNVPQGHVGYTDATSPDSHDPWGPRFQLPSSIAPPVPAKSPERRLRSEQLPREHNPGPQGMIHPALRENGAEREMMRIVSKENIRAALGGLTPESSIEDIRARTKRPTRVASPPRLEAYNSHMFPRKDRRPSGSEH